MSTVRMEKVDIEVLLSNLGLTEDEVIRVLRIGRGMLNEWKATKAVPYGLSDELRRIARGDSPSRAL